MNNIETRNTVYCATSDGKHKHNGEHKKNIHARKFAIRRVSDQNNIAATVGDTTLIAKKPQRNPQKTTITRIAANLFFLVLKCFLNDAGLFNPKSSEFHFFFFSGMVYRVEIFIFLKIRLRVENRAPEMTAATIRRRLLKNRIQFGINEA